MQIEGYADKDRLVMHSTIYPGITCTFWSNLNAGAKMVRVLELPYANFTCDMPKILSRNQFAVRLLQAIGSGL